MGYKTEFPDFDADFYCPAGFEDYSYHNDTMPHAGKRLTVDGKDVEINIWQDYMDDDKREYPGSGRLVFQVKLVDDDDIVYEYITDDLGLIKKFVQEWDEEAIRKVIADKMNESYISGCVMKILEGESVRAVLLESAPAIKEAFAVYTGGGIWLFYGKLSDGNWFLTDDYGATRILNADPSDLDESTYEEWQQEHLVRDLMGNDRLDFCDALCDYIEKADQSHRGGMSDMEIDAYRKYFKEEY